MLTEDRAINAILPADMITTIIFDLYGVLLADVYSDWLAARGIEKTQKYTDLMNSYDTNAISSEIFYTTLADYTAIPEYDIRSGLHQPVEVSSEMRALLERLSGYFKLGLLSNSSQRAHIVLQETALAAFFNEVVISADVGVVKPQPEIFEIMLDRIGSAPAETIFIDDNNQNVASAATLGIHAIQFQNPVALVEFLQATLGDEINLDGIVASHL